MPSYIRTSSLTALWLLASATACIAQTAPTTPSPPVAPELLPTISISKALEDNRGELLGIGEAAPKGTGAVDEVVSLYSMNKLLHAYASNVSDLVSMTLIAKGTSKEKPAKSLLAIRAKGIQQDVESVIDDLNATIPRFDDSPTARAADKLRDQAKELRDLLEAHAQSLFKSKDF